MLPAPKANKGKRHKTKANSVNKQKIKQRVQRASHAKSRVIEIHIHDHG